jgi:hypothetical protein
VADGELLVATIYGHTKQATILTFLNVNPGHLSVMLVSEFSYRYEVFSRSCWIRKEAALFTSSIRSHTSSTAPPSPYAFFLAALGLNSGSQACYVGTLALEPHPHCFLALVIFQIGSCAFCSGQPQPAILLIPPK